MNIYPGAHRAWEGKWNLDPEEGTFLPSLGPHSLGLGTHRYNSAASVWWGCYVLTTGSLGIDQEVGPERRLGLWARACGFPEELF